METLILFGFVVVAVSTVGYYTWTIYNARRPNRAKENRIWQQFAEAWGYNFIPGGRRDADTFITGSYQGYFLTLRTLQTETGHVKTHLSLSRNKQAKISDDEDDVLRNFTYLAGRHQFAGTVGAEPGGRRVFYEQLGVETNPKNIRSMIRFLHKVATLYPQLIEAGGAAVSALREQAQNPGILQQVSQQLLKDIGRETKRRLGDEPSKLWCSQCLMKCTEIKVEVLQWEWISYYGCSGCGQSQTFLLPKGGVVAVLDDRETTTRIEKEGVLRVNWLNYHKLFDFNQVDIVHATDEEVERFVVQIGNDTRTDCQERYEQITCHINSECKLSANTLRILKQMFGKVSQDRSF